MLENNYIAEKISLLTIFFRFIKGMLVAFIISIILFAIISLVLQMTDFPENYVSVCVTATSVISLFLASLISAKSIGASGWLYGMVISIFYSIVLIGVGSILNGGFSFNPQWGFNSIISILSGIIGGIAGINFSSKK